MHYEVGHVVTFRTVNDETVTDAYVVARVDQLWDGKPGFVATVNGNTRTWGLDSEILTAVPAALAIIIGVDGEMIIRDVAPEIDTVRTLIGCEWLEEIAGPDWQAYVDEEAGLKAATVAVNQTATQLIAALKPELGGQLIRGTVVFFGKTRGGGECNVPYRVIAAADRLTFKPFDD